MISKRGVSFGESPAKVHGIDLALIVASPTLFTRGKVDRRRAQLEESVGRYLDQLDTADRHEPTEVLAMKAERLKEKLAKLKEEMAKLATIEAQMLASPDQQVSLTDPDSRSMATSGRASGVALQPWAARGSARPGFCFFGQRFTTQPR